MTSLHQSLAGPLHMASALGEADCAGCAAPQLLGRDKDQKVWCVAKNKWGTVQSRQVVVIVAMVAIVAIVALGTTASI